MSNCYREIVAGRLFVVVVAVVASLVAAVVGTAAAVDIASAVDGSSVVVAAVVVYLLSSYGLRGFLGLDMIIRRRLQASNHLHRRY